MAQAAALRKRVTHAVLASVAIFALSITYWGVNTFQQSEATGTGRTTITFEEFAAPREMGTQSEYLDKGVRFSDDAGNVNRTTALSREGAVGCSAEQIASSGSNRLHPYPNPSSPLVITFTENRVANDVSFQLLGVQSAKNVVEFFDHTGKVLDTKEYVSPGANCDKKELVTLTKANIAKIRITQPGNDFYSTGDGLAIDDFSFAALGSPVETAFSVSPTDGIAPLTVTATYTVTNTGSAATQPTTQTITFEDLQNVPASYSGTPVEVKDQYAATYGVRFSSRVQHTTGQMDSSTPADYVVAHRFDMCTKGNSITSFPFIRQPDPVAASPIRIAFNTPVSAATVGVWSGNVPVYVKAFDANGTELAGKTARVGACDPVNLSTTGDKIASIEVFMKANEFQLGNGIAIDEVSFTRNTATSTPVTNATINWGDGQTAPFTSSIAQHTYATPGTYQVVLTVNGQEAGRQTVRVTQTQQQDPSISFTASKDTYKPGETVQLTLRNGGPGTVELPNGAPFDIKRTDGTSVFAPLATQAIKPLPAGQSTSWTWNQRDDADKQVADGSYIATVRYTANGAQKTKQATFTINKGGVVPPFDGSFSITPTSGTLPLMVTFTCESKNSTALTGLTLDWGDGTVISDATCPSTLTHSFTNQGEYTVKILQGGQLIGTQKVLANAAVSNDGKGAPRVLASTGANLLIVLIVAAVLSGLVSYFILRRPFHGNQAQ